MNKATILLVLIRSMTKAEKRFLKLYSNLQDGDKVYLRLFDLMKECSSVEETARKFGREAEKCSFEIAVKHLYKVVIECLLHLRGRDSIRSRISDCLSEAEILFRCGLFRPAIERLNGAKALALRHEQTACLLLIRQTELQYLSTEDFQEISEKQLVEKQMKVNETFKHLRCAAQHMQLYDILKYRAAHRGKIRRSTISTPYWVSSTVCFRPGCTTKCLFSSPGCTDSPPDPTHRTSSEEDRYISASTTPSG